jgi:hypothetical protein
MHYALNAPVPQHIYGYVEGLKCCDGSGQIAAMPNNRIAWHDPSFVRGDIPKYKVMADVTWHCEQQALDNPHDTAFTK